MIKELFILAKMLFTSHPCDYVGKNMPVRVMQHFPAKGYKAMSWCGTLILRRNVHFNGAIYLNTAQGLRTLRHERIHREQAIATHPRSWMLYYLSYGWHWLRLAPWRNPGKAAYYCNPYEVEAYANDERLGYSVNYTTQHLRGKYTIPHARRLYKQLGGTKEAWIQYIRTL